MQAWPHFLAFHSAWAAGQIQAREENSVVATCIASGLVSQSIMKVCSLHRNAETSLLKVVSVLRIKAVLSKIDS